MRRNAYFVVEKMARPKGFEPLTPRFVVWCSIQLSYGRVPVERPKPEIERAGLHRRGPCSGFGWSLQ